MAKQQTSEMTMELQFLEHHKKQKVLPSFFKVTSGLRSSTPTRDPEQIAEFGTLLDPPSTAVGWRIASSTAKRKLLLLIFGNVFLRTDTRLLDLQRSTHRAKSSTWTSKWSQEGIRVTCRSRFPGFTKPNMRWFEDALVSD